MKCITKDNKILRVDNELAFHKVAKEGWKFCEKSGWKKIRGPVTQSQPKAKVEKKKDIYDQIAEKK